jgi:hypothetical protein
MTWTDFRRSAPWLQRCWKPRQWKQWAGRSKCKIFELGYLTAASVSYDWMHSKYLGMDQYQFGATLYVLVFMVMAATPKQNLSRVWTLVKAYYKDNKTRTRYKYLNKLSMFVRKLGSLSTFCFTVCFSPGSLLLLYLDLISLFWEPSVHLGKSGFAKLRGKAGEIRHFGAALCHVWSLFMNPVLLLHRQIHLMLKLNVKLEDILTEHRDAFKLPDAVAEDFCKTAFAMAQLQTTIADHFIQEGSVQNLFDVTSKTHFVLHSAELAKHVNPRLVWCFRGEDMQAKIQTLLKSCVKHSNGPMATLKMISQYTLALHLVISQHQ